MTGKCEEPLNELSLQIWLLHMTTQTLNVCGTELRTDGQTNGRADDPITR